MKKFLTESRLTESRLNEAGQRETGLLETGPTKTGLAKSRLLKTRTLRMLTLSAAVALAGSFAAMPAHASKEKPVIGFSIDDLRVERWTRDRDYFTAAATKLGAKVYVQSADASEERQIAQIENLISRNIDVLVIVPFNGKVLGNVVAEAKRAGIKVVAYDRLILNADIDAYISFDNERVGEMQAQALVNVVPKGNYFLLGGSPTDNNAKVFRDGQMKVLQPLVTRGDIKIVGQQWTPEWDPTNALRITEDALTANHNNVQAIVASNDGTAGGAIQALSAQKLAGKVAISGQDADLAGVKRVIAGTQTMTVYKPLNNLASQAAQLSVDLVRGVAPKFNNRMNNGNKEVSSELLTPTLLNKQNVDLVIKDGFYTHAQVYGN